MGIYFQAAIPTSTYLAITVGLLVCDRREAGGGIEFPIR